MQQNSPNIKTIRAMKKIRKELMFALLLAAGCLPLTAYANSYPRQDEAEHATKVKLEGIWQLFRFQTCDSGRYDVRVLPVLKIISADGTYSNLSIGVRGGGCGIAEQGTLAKQNDSTLVETLDAGAAGAGQAAPQQLTYKLQGGQWMVIDRKVNDKVNHEIWMRLRKMPNAQKMVQDMINGKERPDNAPNGESPDGRPRMSRQNDNRRGPRMRQERQTQPAENTNNTVDNSWMNED